MELASPHECRPWLTLRCKGFLDVPPISTVLNNHTFMLPVGVLEEVGHSVSRWMEKICYQQCSVWRKYATSSVLSGENMLPAVFCPEKICYQQCSVWRKYTNSSVLSGENMLPAVFCLEKICYQQCSVCF